MHDLDNQIREYIDATSEPLTVDDVLSVPIGEAPVRPISNRTFAAHWSRGWATAAVAAVITVIALGSVPWLMSRTDGGAPAADETPLATAEVTPTTEAAITSDTVPATTATVADVPVVPPGEGTKLSFVQSDVLEDERWNSGVWFKGDLYALVSPGRGGDARDLVRTRDGFTWEVIPGLPGANNVRHSMLQTDGNLLVNVVMPDVGNRGIGSDAFIQVNTSANGTDWTSSRIELPVPSVCNLAGEFHLAEGFFTSDHFAVGPKGIVVTATIDMSFGGEGFANGLVDPDEGIHVEVVDLDLDRGVMILQFLDENNDMEQIGDLREIDLNAAGFSNLVDALAADPDWEPLLPGLIAQLTTQEGPPGASASVGYAWFSSDGGTWQRVDSTGPLAGGEFSGIVATPDGFVATASGTYRPSEMAPELEYLAGSFDNSVVWQSADGMTWTEATGLTSEHGYDTSRIVEWRGEPVELVGTVYSIEDDTKVWTLTDPPQSVFSNLPTGGMRLSISEFGLIGTPSYGWWGPDAWEPTEFDLGVSDGERHFAVSVVGAGDDFVVVQHRGWDESSESPSHSLWVGTIP